MSGVERADVGHVTLRYWAALRAAADSTGDEVTSGPLDEVLAAAVALHPDNPRFARVLAICSVLVDEEPVSSLDPTVVVVAPASVVDLLPPFAGG